MYQFSQVNKKAARVSNCCQEKVRISGNPLTQYHNCDKCSKHCDEVSFYEYLTEQLSNILLDEKLPLDIVRADTGEYLIPANRKITKSLIKKVSANYNMVEIDPSPIRHKVREVIDSATHKFNMEFN